MPRRPPRRGFLLRERRGIVAPSKVETGGLNMKKYLAAVALVAAIAQPAAAVTFPTLTTIYVGTGLSELTPLANTTGVVSCANVSGQTANLRVLILNFNGAVADTHTQALAHGANMTVGTRGAASLSITSMDTPAPLLNGTVNIESTESAVFCTAMLIDKTTPGPNGVTLRLVRSNGHPGAEE